MPPLEGDSTTPNTPGVKGTNSVAGNGIFGDSTQSDAVVGFAHAAGKAGVLGLSPDGNAVAGISDRGSGVFGQGGQFAGSFVGNVIVTGQLTVLGISFMSLVQQVSGFQQQLSTLHQLVNNIQQQLSNLQQKEAADVQGIATSLLTLAARITALGG